MAENKTWMPTVAGILDIIAGGWGIILAFIFIFIGAIARFVPDVPPYLFPIFTALAFPFIIGGIVAIIGGIYALKRKIWGLALAGSICAFFPSWILGLTAIVLVVLSKKEFE